MSGVSALRAMENRVQEIKRPMTPDARLAHHKEHLSQQVDRMKAVLSKVDDQIKKGDWYGALSLIDGRQRREWQDAMKELEDGCRTGQNDPDFNPELR